MIKVQISLGMSDILHSKFSLQPRSGAAHIAKSILNKKGLPAALGFSYSPHFNCHNWNLQFRVTETYGLPFPLIVLKGPVHFAPEISGDVRALPSTDVSSESMMQSARSSSIERGTGDRILKPRISNGEGDDNKKCIRAAKGGRGGKVRRRCDAEHSAHLAE